MRGVLSINSEITMSKQVASTLKAVLGNPIVEAVQDRSSFIEEFIPTVENFWGYDLYTRKPGPAYRDGVFVGTDLDLACFLYALVDRKAVIQLPTYRSVRPRSIREGEMLSSKTNRHGKIFGLVSNKDTFIFSVKIKDMNVMTTDEVGGFRNFAITNFDGTWYDGWTRIQFMPTAEENDFLDDKNLWTGNTVVFKNFVSPNRWTSFYGQYYFITKCLTARLREEAAYYRATIKKFETQGVKWTERGETGAKREWGKSTKEEGKTVKVNAFEVEVDLPERTNDFYDFKPTTDSLVEMQRRIDLFTKTISKLQFMTRATELSFFNKCPGDYSPLPAWVKNASWEQGYVKKGRRKQWDRLVLFQPAVGETGVSLRKRLWEKTEEVSKTY